jgi:hypothetical protein
MLFLLLVALLVCWGSNAIVLDVESLKVVKAADFAVHELSKLSDSNIYETLELSQILSADEVDGLFHKNILLHLELKSPHFASRKLVENFHMIVMRHKEDNVTTLAIDEFPIMDEDAIEEFYIRKIEERRKLRDQAFDELELEAMEFLEKEFSAEVEKKNMKMKKSSRAVESEVEITPTGTMKAKTAQEFDVDDTILEKVFKKKDQTEKGQTNDRKSAKNLEDLDLNSLHNLLKKIQK